MSNSLWQWGDFNGFAPPSLGVRLGLDKLHEQGFRDFLLYIDHDKNNHDHRCRASEALATLMEVLAQNRQPPDYGDPYVAAAYLVKYHLSHCSMAYWAFKHLLGHIGSIPNTLYVCDVGAGTGAARVGLTAALLKSKEHCEKSPPTIHFDAVEPSCAMRTAGGFFWDALPPEAKSRRIVPRCGYREGAELPEQLPPEIRDRDDTLRVVTAFHLSLPYSDPCGNVGDAKSSIQSALDLVCPDFGVFTAHHGKATPLKRAVGEYDCEFPIPRDHEGVPDRSQFYTACAEELGFKVPDGSPVRDWSRYRFAPPRGVLLLLDRRT